MLSIDKRPHIGGNAYDRIDEAGLLVHEYGPHIFHANTAMVFEYLSRFTAWRPYEHWVRGQVDGKLVPIPINLDTVNTRHDLQLEAANLPGSLAGRAEPVADVSTAEDVVVSQVGSGAPGGGSCRSSAGRDGRAATDLDRADRRVVRLLGGPLPYGRCASCTKPTK